MTLSLTSSLATSLCWIQVDIPHWIIPTQASMCPRGVFWLPSTVQRLASEVSWHLQTVSRRERECGCLLDPWRSGNSPRMGWPAVTLRQLGYAAGCRNLGCSMEMNSWMMDVRDLWYIRVRLTVFLFLLASVRFSHPNPRPVLMKSVQMLSRHPAGQWLDLKWFSTSSKSFWKGKIEERNIREFSR